MAETVDPALSIIILSDRPDCLRGLLAALAIQTRIDFEIVVLDQGGGRSADLFDRWSCETGRLGHDVGAFRVMNFRDWGQTVKFDAARDRARGEYVMFPNDDSYYVPTFVDRMLGAAERHDLDLVLCNWVFDKYGYIPYDAKPQTGHFDVGGFIARRALVVADGWTDRGSEGDGKLVERIVAGGAKWGKVPGYLYVKN